MTIIFLPGWGKTPNDYTKLINLLKPRYQVMAIALPGFPGKLAYPYRLKDYADYVAGFIKLRRLSKVVLVGHSFGGRVALKTALLFPDLVEKLVLIGSSGIERKPLRVRALALLARFTPEKIRNFTRPLFGSRDFLEANETLRETLKLIVAENLETDLPSIKLPALLVWGEEDRTIPLEQGKLMQRLMANSILKVVTTADHGLPYRKPEETAKLITDFLR